jgi:predicted GH43/DUF377 family glycosyl hydrolase
MLRVKKEGVLLRKAGFEFEDESVLNPAVIHNVDKICMFYRAVHTKNFSTIGYCEMHGPLTVSKRWDKPVLTPHFDYERHGMEDPRIVKIDDTFYLSYVAFDGNNALGALITSTDLKHFTRRGIVVPKITLTDFDRLTKNEVEINKRYLAFNAGANILADKDFVFFPRRINNKLVFLHRIKPGIQTVAVNELDELTDEFWNNYFMHFKDNLFLESKYPHEAEYVGSGCPPIETGRGWLVIYHGVRKHGKGLEYSACAALMDLDDPRKEIARLPRPLFKPELDYELTGDVDDVCFPTGAIIENGRLYIYYGAADELIACASVDLEELVNELLNHKL